MPLNEPSWWYGADARGRASLLWPLSYVYGRIAGNRLKFARPYTSLIPVISVGNFTAGGTGKTPLTILLAERLRDMGERPALLTRGYGGAIRGPHLVDPAADRARDTGDEALLLARAAPTVISRDRVAGARYFESMTHPPSVIVMDDGMQNPNLAKMLRIAVVDGRRGIGNGRVIPAGPLRAPLADQLELVDAIVLNRGPSTAPATMPALTCCTGLAPQGIGCNATGTGTGAGSAETNPENFPDDSQSASRQEVPSLNGIPAPAVTRDPALARDTALGHQPSAAAALVRLFRAARFAGPILNGWIVPRGDVAGLKTGPVVAFAGIGHPERFFDTLRVNGIDVAAAIAFKDHHFFDAGDAERLLRRADTLGARLVTTAKDHVRLLSYDDQRGELARRTTAFDIEMVLSPEACARIDRLLQQALLPADPMAEDIIEARA